tara:strand:- start:923 stop:1438 length:516 start_codon:yes stop_codon:yes gene_type:complete
MQKIGGIMKALLNEIIQNSRWSYPAFGGKLIIKGRILSPIESQTVGISAALIASGIASRKDLEMIQSIKNKKDVTDDNADDLFDALKNFDSDKILKMARNQDKVLCQCICSGSMDDGVTWQDMSVCHEEKQQKASQNRLWVGMFTEEDRGNMLELCLQGHKKAADAIRGAV